MYGTPEYDAWVARVNASIARINAAIRATNGPKFGPSVVQIESDSRGELTSKVQAPEAN